jgi:hypothetical protein
MHTRYKPSATVCDQVEQAFRYHPPQGDQAQRYESLRGLARDLAIKIIHSTPTGRNQSLALTKLQEAVMHANAAIAVNEVWDGDKLTHPPLDAAG